MNESHEVKKNQLRYQNYDINSQGDESPMRISNEDNQSQHVTISTELNKSQIEHQQHQMTREQINIQYYLQKKI